jgi:hypothetical protein
MNDISEFKKKIMAETKVDKFSDESAEFASHFLSDYCSYHPDREAVVIGHDDDYKNAPPTPLCEQCYLFKIELIEREKNGEVGGW